MMSDIGENARRKVGTTSPFQSSSAHQIRTCDETSPENRSDFAVTAEVGLGEVGRGVWNSDFDPELEERRSAEFDMIGDYFVGHNAFICDDCDDGISISGKNNIIVGVIFDQYKCVASWMRFSGALAIPFDLDEINLKGKTIKLIVPFENFIITPC